MRYLIVAILICASLFSANAQNNRYDQNQDGSVMSPDGFYAGFGTGSLDNLGANRLSYQFVLGRLWNTTKYLGVKTTAEVTSDFENAIIASALVGANVYPVLRNFSPYIGAAAGIGYANGSGPGDALGLDVSGTIGLMLFRTAPFQVNIEGNTNVIFRKVQDNSIPMTFTGRIGLLF